MRAADGRRPGRRGRATRQRLLDCTATCCSSSSYRELKVVDIAREAGTSPATFYQYFADVESAVVVLAEEMVGRGPCASPTSCGPAPGGAQGLRRGRGPGRRGHRVLGGAPAGAAGGRPGHRRGRRPLRQRPHPAAERPQQRAGRGHRRDAGGRPGPRRRRGPGHRRGAGRHARPRVGPPLRLRVLGRPHRGPAHGHGPHRLLVRLRPEARPPPDHVARPPADPNLRCAARKIPRGQRRCAEVCRVWRAASSPSPGRTETRSSCG